MKQRDESSAMKPPIGEGVRFCVMDIFSRTFRWIAATLTAMMLLGPLAPAAHACIGMSTSSMSGHLTAASDDALTPASSESPEPVHAHHDGAPTHDSEASTASKIESGPSHDCNGPCTGSDCCSMQATPTSRSDGFLAERVSSVSLTVSATAKRFTPLFPRADRAPPQPTQPDLFPSLLSVRLHVWTATFLT